VPPSADLEPEALMMFTDPAHADPMDIGYPMDVGCCYRSFGLVSADYCPWAKVSTNRGGADLWATPSGDKRPKHLNFRHADRVPMAAVL